MTSSVSQAPPRDELHRLLGHPTDLAGHVGVHGPLSAAVGNDASWRRAVTAGLEASGLSGRGGAGFPTSVKVAMATSHGQGGTVVVNGMESEPASDKDKVLLTRAPHLVLDGAQIVAAMCRAEHIVVCIPAGRDGVAAVVTHAMAERAAAQYGGVSETIIRPPDRFIAGEESALVGWVASGQPLPAFRPDKGTPLLIGKRHALVHNAETLAHIALIARRGPDQFRARGLPEEPGTCLVTIGGAVVQPGVVEVDRGTPLQDIVSRGTPTGPIRAFLVGGYGGAWIGSPHFAMPYASMSLRTVGAKAGVGVIIVLGETSCGIAESARIARYLAGQSSGQCGPCVFGLPAIADDMSLLARGQVDPALRERLHRRLGEVSGRGACRHPDGAVGLVRSAFTVFAEDVVSHEQGEPCAQSGAPTILRFPRPVSL